ncbi:MAG TPA: plastocyanin/azurin family copper-binding protein [Solirubrobacteraceae bacterium]|nr:plastocyanin/azurin family copper-binding protein [Solirubrobacteraceae bacterium]
MLAVQLAPVLAAEKSKTAFFVAGGLLVAWALFVSLGIGLRNPNLPAHLGGQRALSAITAVLVLATLATAVITSGGEENAGAESKPTYTQFGANTPDTAAPESANATALATAETTAPTESAPAPAPQAKTKPAKTTPAKTTPAKTTPAKKQPPKATTGTPPPPSSPAAATTLKLEANPAGQLSYTTKQLTAKAGKVTIDFSNSSPVEHDVAIAQGSTVVGQTPIFTGGSKTLAVTLKPGTYSFYCTVPGHRAAGMEGTLKVS